jgi:hypothetical protein
MPGRRGPALAKRYKVPQWEIVEAETYWRDPDIRLGCTPRAMAVDPDPARHRRHSDQDSVRRTFPKMNGCRRTASDRHSVFLPTADPSRGIAHRRRMGVVATEVMGYGTGFFFAEEIKIEPMLVPRIKDVVTRFWAETIAGRIPKFDFELDSEVIEALHPKPLVKEPALDLSADNRLPDLLPKRKQRKDYIKRAEKWVDTADAMIKENPVRMKPRHCRVGNSLGNCSDASSAFKTHGRARPASHRAKKGKS